MQDRVGKVLTEKTGVILDAEFAVGDPVQKVSIMAATGDVPDLIAAKSDLGKLIDVGAVLDLTDLVDKHAPNIKKMLGDKIVRIKYSLDDPAIYAIPTWSSVDERKFKAEGGFQLQHRVVKEAGYPEIRTVEDYEKVIKDYLAKHPTDENGNKNIGLTLNADDWHMYQVTNMGFMTTGAPDDGEYYVNQETFDVTYHFRRPEEREYFRWLNHMNDIGLLDPESFVQKTDQFRAKVASGRVLGLIDPAWDFGEAQQALKAAGKFDQTYGHYPVTLTKEYKDTSFWPAGFDGGYGIAISSKCKDPVAAIKFLDFLASEEGQVLNNWGIEGTDYVVQDGKRVVPADIQQKMDSQGSAYTKESGIGLYWNLMVHYGDGIKDSTGNYFTKSNPELLTATYSEPEKEALAAYGIEHWRDLFPKEEEFPERKAGAVYNIALPSDSTAAILGTKMRDITWKRIPEAIMAEPSRFDQIWDAYLAELEKAGVKEMEEAYGQFVKDRVKLWSGE
ncbi:MAG: ABC transporter substrate-binding protein [Paenibacillus macerans]|nr:ABC transporter substrate-binding protein [Paenibacillus macerans]MCY7558657.1 ABC transporter substrate-binding protein [Paenibacillus macerans]MDU7474797.1 ABC transporter substrate-binding protein [Paenibacillus macerans]MEC0140263.1 ABC transporter substrate-binding protein [Paenibacillus macerans]MEC0154210.1 ABC transporter substrate-binding protein [Paenibacillus macerans]UMV50976.1 ABC transporter substrate-binding protein [Paenibacillus macerans]